MGWIWDSCVFYQVGSCFLQVVEVPHPWRCPRLCMGPWAAPAGGTPSPRQGLEPWGLEGLFQPNRPTILPCRGCWGKEPAPLPTFGLGIILIFTVHEKEIFSGSSLGRRRGKGEERKNKHFLAVVVPFWRQELGAARSGLAGGGKEHSQHKGRSGWAARGVRCPQTVWDGDPTITAGPAWLLGGEILSGKGVRFLC